MISPLYSIILCDQSLSEYENKISVWLQNGIKVFWFGNVRDAELLKKEYARFLEAFLLQVYDLGTNVSVRKNVIIDGRDNSNYISQLEKICPVFNAAQYRVEHCQTDQHIIVQASAGTGKTTVMIDRIMYLMHMLPNLKLSEIYMITFTNDAANEMNIKLQKMLMKRFNLTGNIKYFKWLEELSQMNISTIDSFAFKMLKEYGIGQSFTGKLSIKNNKYEKKELVKDMLDKYTTDSFSIKSQIGLPLYKANSLIRKYWEEFAKIGISRADMEKMNWGKAEGENSAIFQKMLSDIVCQLDDRYWDIKRKNDAISVSDIMRDLQEVLQSSWMPCPDIFIKYLFIDEFQDSNLSQIMVSVLLVKLFHAKLFVVGDVKQSIYGFRGAVEQSFEVLKCDLNKINARPAREFTLVNNYRTAANVMSRMNDYFKIWGTDGLLKYDGPVIPFNRTKGIIKMLDGDINPQYEDDIIADLAKEQLDRLVRQVESSGQKPSPKDRVVMLTRTNTELTKLNDLLRKNHIPASMKLEGSFYISETVRDFYALICSYMFITEPKYIFEYLLTPYAGEIEPIDINLMESFEGQKERLQDYLRHFVNQTNWEKYYKEFRLKPVMAVIKHIIDEEPILENFIMNYKRRLEDLGWGENRCIAATRTKAIQYQANLERLLEILQNNLSGDKVSLYDVYHYLQLQIATNRSESEPNVELEDDYTSILCMTVHKSKGLEFDTVIIPYTHRRFPDKYNTEILIDPLTYEVGWNMLREKNSSEMRNTSYAKMKNLYIEHTRAEETRVLYVAMTRAINNLYCIVHPPKDSNRWAYLIKEGGLDYE